MVERKLPAKGSAGSFVCYFRRTSTVISGGCFKHQVGLDDVPLCLSYLLFVLLTLLATNQKCSCHSYSRNRAQSDSQTLILLHRNSVMTKQPFLITTILHTQLLPVGELVCLEFSMDLLILNYSLNIFLAILFGVNISLVSDDS